MALTSLCVLDSSRSLSRDWSSAIVSGVAYIIKSNDIHLDENDDQRMAQKILSPLQLSCYQLLMIQTAQFKSCLVVVGSS